MRSLLSVPASQPKMVEKALTLDCDQIILDLEDSVTPADKAAARTYLKDFLSKVESKKRISLRVNELSSAFAKADIDLICGFNPQPLSSVILPKIQNLDDVKSWAAKLPAGMQLEVQIESAMGLIQAPHIASHPQVISLAFGPADFMASVGMPSSNPGTPWPEVANALQWPLMQVVIAAHAHGKTAYDGPYFQISDDLGLSSAARTARALGVDGKWVIHPNQIALVNEAFTPSPEEIAHAEEIVAAFNASSGATNLAGLMIDEASKKVAERLLERVTQIRR
jgi:citrate lyase subunit beta/citryl-CoA lyase